MKLLKKFQTEEQYLAFASSKAFVEPNTSLVVGTDTVKFNSDNPAHDYSQDFFTIEAVDNTVSISLNKSIEYSLDDGKTWITPGEGSGSGSGGSSEFELSRGQHCLFSYEKDIHDDRNIAYVAWNITGHFKVYGNIMSLYSSNFISENSFDERYDENVFKELFKGMGVTDAKNLILPATALTNYCYQSMFENCTSLTEAPVLPATEIAGNCYSSMFKGCSSLTTAPELPATTLVSSCYSSMFYNCTGLTTAPDLLAPSFEGGCYQYMFYGCTSLNYIKCLAYSQTHFGYSTELGDWVYNVAENGTFVKNSNAPIGSPNWEYGSDGIPVGWTVINE